MKTDNPLLNIFLTLLTGALIGGLLLGLLAFLVAGSASVPNGLTLGATFGLVSSMALMGQINFVNFWMGYARRIGQSRFDGESDHKGK